MSASEPWQPLAAQILAIVLPLAVLISSTELITSTDPSLDTATVQEIKRAGHTMNGSVFYGDVKAQIVRDLKEQERRVLVLGNSFANANLDPDETAHQIGIEPTQISVFAIPNSVSSHWYAILKNEVFSRGFRPELVIIVSSFQAMLMVEPYSEASRRNLVIHLQPSEPVLDRYIRRDPLWLEQWTSQRLLWRQAALDTLRDTSVGLVYDGNTEAAMRRLFRDDKLEETHWQSGPLVGDLHKEGPFDAGRSDADGSLLLELASLVEANGARLLLIRSPSAPNTPTDLRDVAGGNVSEVAALLERRGHHLLDATERAAPREWFANYRHMTPEGARFFTGSIGDDLRRSWMEAKRHQFPVEQDTQR